MVTSHSCKTQDYHFVAIVMWVT